MLTICKTASRQLNAITGIQSYIGKKWCWIFFETSVSFFTDITASYMDPFITFVTTDGFMINTNWLFTY